MGPQEGLEWSAVRPSRHDKYRVRKAPAEVASLGGVSGWEESRRESRSGRGKCLDIVCRKAND